MLTMITFTYNREFESSTSTQFEKITAKAEQLLSTPDKITTESVKKITNTYKYLLTNSDEKMYPLEISFTANNLGCWLATNHTIYPNFFDDAAACFKIANLKNNSFSYANFEALKKLNSNIQQSNLLNIYSLFGDQLPPITIPDNKSFNLTTVSQNPKELKYHPYAQMEDRWHDVTDQIYKRFKK